MVAVLRAPALILPWPHATIVGVAVLSAIRESLNLLTPRDRRLLSASVFAQMATSLLDLAGVLLIGLVGALAVTAVQSEPPPTAVMNVVSRIGLEDLSSQTLVLTLAAAAAIILLVKSALSSYLTRRVLTFLANRQALVSARLTASLLSQPLTFIQRRSSQLTAFALIQGAGAATVQVLGQMTIVATEMSLMIVLSCALLFVDPTVTIAAVVFFSLVAYSLQRAMGGWATSIGVRGAEADVESLNVVQEALSTYREIAVANRRFNYVTRFQQLRWEAAKVGADLAFIGMIPKYVLEAALVGGGFLLAGFLFATSDSVVAVATLALFIAASSRVMPSLLRLQGALIGLRGAAGSAAPTFELATDLSDSSFTPDSIRVADSPSEATSTSLGPFTPDIHLSHIDFTYPGAGHPALTDVSLSVPYGVSVALVGESGAGKSTLADIILGVLQPEHGTVLVNGVPPEVASRKWPGGMAYVPQEVVLANASIRSNVALGVDPESISDSAVRRALEQAQLMEHLAESRAGIETDVGERGLRLSGGQRQRIGVARALYSEPRLLVLDEATSALDAETEANISEMLVSLRGAVTLIIIAHRLSTIRNVDLVVYLEKGRVAHTGSFNAVRNAVPALERQARLMGL